MASKARAAVALDLVAVVLSGCSMVFASVGRDFAWCAIFGTLAIISLCMVAFHCKRLEGKGRPEEGADGGGSADERRQDKGRMDG